MRSTRAPIRMGRRAGWTWIATVAVLMMLMGPIGAGAAPFQDENTNTPETIAPGTGLDDGDVTPEPTEVPTTDEPRPATTRPSSGQFDLDPTGPGSPAVIAQGLAFLTGDRVVWQVREVSPQTVENASSRTARTAILYQVTGSTIVRNDITGKRMLLEPGEAGFLSGGDPYTVMANTNDSLIWAFEVVGDAEVDDAAFYESPLIDDYAQGVYDLEMIRYVLAPGQIADLPTHTGPALVMSAEGDIDIESGGLGLLATADGQLVSDSGTVANNSDQPVVYLVVALGEQIDDGSASAGQAQSAAEPTAPPAAQETTKPDSNQDDSSGTGSSEFRTGLNITALSDLYVVVVVDGVTAFDGPIPSGGQSGVIVGTAFRVYTTWGAQTMFTNSCGEDFFMGYEEGEVTYVLEANANSCAP